MINADNLLMALVTCIWIYMMIIMNMPMIYRRIFAIILSVLLFTSTWYLIFGSRSIYQCDCDEASLIYEDGRQ